VAAPVHKCFLESREKMDIYGKGQNLPSNAEQPYTVKNDFLPNTYSLKSSLFVSIYLQKRKPHLSNYRYEDHKSKGKGTREGRNKSAIT
jgi:hypothetical protein